MGDFEIVVADLEPRVDGQRRRAGRVGAQALHQRNDSSVPGDKAGTQPGRAGALREAMKHHQIRERVVALAYPQRSRRLERPWRRRLIPDFGVAFVHRQDEIVTPGQPQRAFQVIKIGHRAFRIRRRAKI